MKKYYKSGFTLVELAIVLVIIGLLVGGVLAGQELIHNARLNSDIHSIKEFDLSVQIFRLKYDCLPGDCRKASAFFPGSYNGNGDNIINNEPPPSSNVISNGYFMGYENAYAIDHLARANLIKTAPFNANDTSLNTDNVIPKLKSGGHFMLLSECKFNITLGGCLSNGYLTYRLGIAPVTFDAGIGLGTFDTRSSPEYIPQDAIFIDSKLDDGKPMTGIVKVGYNSSADDGYMLYPVSVEAGRPDSCLLYPNNEYDLSTKDKICGIFIRSGI